MWEFGAGLADHISVNVSLAHAGLKGSMALSQAVIAGGAVAGVAVTLHKKHPHDPARPLMDFDIALMLLPFLLLGVSFGWAPVL